MVWEFAHLPLYTIWQEDSAGSIQYAVFHCTIGDVLIAAASLLIALFLVGRSSWPSCHFVQVVIVATLIGLSYTVFSEWLNIEVRQSWAYSPLMPTLPFLGTGLSPLAQWTVIPLASFWLVHRFTNKISYS
ncbi:MAG: hypothetical protein K8F25_13000 [Fimbriimonadaceae bacterium]|nr:hypothetical protein [Alphaproteobacteria bacterium]